MITGGSTNGSAGAAPCDRALNPEIDRSGTCGCSDNFLACALCGMIFKENP